MFAKMSRRLQIGLVLAVALMVFRFGIAPLFAWRHETVERIKILQEAVARKKVLIRNEKKIDARLPEVKKFLEKTAKFYFSDFTDVQALQLKLQKELERLSAANGVEINNTNWLYPVEGDIVQVSINIRCEARPEQLIKLLAAIEGSPHFFTLDRLKITSRGQSTIRAEIDVGAYGIKNNLPN